MGAAGVHRRNDFNAPQLAHLRFLTPGPLYEAHAFSQRASLLRAM